MTDRQEIASRVLPMIYDPNKEYGWMVTVAYRMADEFLAFDAPKPTESE